MIVEFLCGSTWPFHGCRRLSATAAAAVRVSGGDVESYWILDRDVVVGLIRLLDLDDVDDGSPVFDLRIGEEHRGRGIGTAAVSWLSAYLFDRFAVLHRIEATTRDDNLAMQTVLERCGYWREGVLREAWKNDDGSRNDAVVYGLLRHERLGSDS